MGVSLNGGTQQPWVFLLKCSSLGCFGVPPFKETPIYHLEIIIAPYKKFRVLGVDTAIYFHHSEFIILCTVAILPYETSPDPELFYYPPWPGLQDAPADGWWSGCQGAARCFTCQDLGLILNLILILGYGTARFPNQNDTCLG